MDTLAKMKSHIVELEVQKRKLQTELDNMRQQSRFSMWGIGVGAVLAILYLIGFLPQTVNLVLISIGLIVLVAGLIMTIVYASKRSNYTAKIEQLEAEIHKLMTSMA